MSLSFVPSPITYEVSRKKNSLTAVSLSDREIFTFPGCVLGDPTTECFVRRHGLESGNLAEAIVVRGDKVELVEAPKVKDDTKVSRVNYNDARRHIPAVVLDSLWEDVGSTRRSKFPH